MTDQRLLGFDYGSKRIGVAVGQTVLGSATPLTQLSVTSGKPDRAAVAKLIEEWRPHAFVVGLPLNMDDTLSDSARAAQHFGKWLEKEFKKPVHFVDERLSSREARERLTDASNGKKYTKEQLNSVAAQIILEDFFAQQPK